MRESAADVKHTSTIDQHIGHRIAELRTAQGVTRKELAKQIGITHQQLQKYEKGINRIAASRLAEIAHALSLPVSIFFEQEKHTVSLDNRGYLRHQRLYIDVMHDFAAIENKKQQEAVRTLLRSMRTESA